MGEWDVVKEEKLDPWSVVEERPIGDFLQTAGVTPEASFDFVQSVKRNALPVAGDVAMSYLGSKLPAGRSLMGPAMARTVQTGLAGAAGAMGGEAAAQQVFDEPTNPNKIKEQGAMGFAGSMGLQGFFGIMRPAVKFMRPALDPIFNLATDLTVVGSRTKSRLRERLLGEATDRAEKFVYDVAPEAVKNADVGIESIRLRMQTALDENKAVYGAYKDALRKASEKEGGLLIDDTQQFLSDKLKEHFAKNKKIGTFLPETFGYRPQADPEIAFSLRNILKSAEDGMPASVADVESVFAKVYGTKFDKINHEVWQNNRVALKDTLMRDLEKHSEAFGLKAEADSTVRAVSQFKYLYEKVFGPALREGKLDPMKLAENIYLHKKDILKRDELKDLWPALEKEAKVYQDVAGTLKRSEPSVNFGGGLSQGLGSLAGFARMGPEGAAAAELFGYMSAYALLPQLSKTVLQKSMRGGTEAVAKTGLRLGNDYIDFQREGTE